MKNKIDWTRDQIHYENYPSERELLDQDIVNIMSDNQKFQPIAARSTDNPARDSLTNQSISSEDEINRIVNLRIKEILEVRDSRQGENLSCTQIGLQEAIQLLPKSCDGKDTKQLEIFLEKCEFAVSCTVGAAFPKLLYAIQTRLTGSTRRATKYRTFGTWEEFRDLLKVTLKPQRTTQHLYLELYVKKQKMEKMS